MVTHDELDGCGVACLFKGTRLYLLRVHSCNTVKYPSIFYRGVLQFQICTCCISSGVIDLSVDTQEERLSSNLTTERCACSTPSSIFRWARTRTRLPGPALGGDTQQPTLGRIGMFTSRGVVQSMTALNAPLISPMSPFQQLFEAGIVFWRF